MELTKNAPGLTIAANDDEKRPVQMRLSYHTLGRVEELKEWLGVANRTQAIAKAIQISYAIINILRNEDGELYFRSGTKVYPVVIEGLFESA